MNNRLGVITILLALIASSCSFSGRAPERLPGVDIPLQDMNIKLKLSVPSEANTFKFNDILSIMAQDLSGNPILFDRDYGIKVFMFQDGQWQVIQNDFVQPPGHTELLPVAQQPMGGIVIDLHPVILQQQAVTIRVVVIGQLEVGGQSTQSVGAYTDVTLRP